MRIVGAIPAAGYGTRLQPLRGSKELVPIRGKPVLEYIAERMTRGGATELRVVTRPEKTDVVEHATALGASVVLAHPPTVSASIAAASDGLDDDDVVLIGFPDTLWEPGDGYRTLVRALNECDVALGLFRLPSSELGRSDVVVVENGRIDRVHVKSVAPQSDLIWGCAAVRAHALDGIARCDWPGEHFDVLCRAGRAVFGVLLSDVWIDVGTPEALSRAERMPLVLSATA